MQTSFPLLSSALLTATIMSSASATPLQTGYAPVNGLQLYYELYGPAESAQPPLVLLHGGGDTIQTSFGHLLPILAQSRRIIAFEQQGYGHTTDIVERPFTFEQSADDTAALLAHLGVERADLLGFSNGGTIALQVAIRHPQRVRKLVLVSALFSRDGGVPWLWEHMKTARLENMPVELQEAYRKVAPHPENLRLFHDKAAQRVRDFRDIPTEALRAITAPTLTLVGDADVVRPEHAIELARMLPQGQVGVLPSTDHMQIMTRTELLAPMLARFLEAGVEKKQAPEPSD